MSSRKSFELALRTAKMRERVTNQITLGGDDEVRGIDHALYCAYKDRNRELPETRPREGEDRGHVNWLHGHLRDADPTQMAYIPPGTSQAILLNPYSVAQLNDHAPLERLLPRMVYSKDERDGVVQLSMLLEESFAEKAEEFFSYGIHWLQLYTLALDTLSKVHLLAKLPKEAFEENPLPEVAAPYLLAFEQVQRNINLVGLFKAEAKPAHYHGPCRVASLVHRMLRFSRSERVDIPTGTAIPQERLAQLEKRLTLLNDYVDLYRKAFKVQSQQVSA